MHRWFVCTWEEITIIWRIYDVYFASNKMYKPVLLIRKSSAILLWWSVLWFIKEDVSIFGRIRCFQVTGQENL